MAPIKKDIKQESDREDWEMISDGASTVQLEENNELELGEPSPKLSPEPIPNPVGELQNLCVRRFWPLPEYSEEYTIGPAHLRTFSIKCSVREHSTSASGSSKKMAKKASAAAMLTKLREMPPTSTFEEERPIPPELTEIENTLNTLKLSVGDADPEPVTAAELEDQLKDLAQRSGVIINARAGSDIEGRSVWICEVDGVVVTGYGNNAQEARIDAAKGVVHRLRMKLEV